MKKTTCNPADLDLLPEYTEAQIAALLSGEGLGGFTTCCLPLALAVGADVGPAGTDPLETAILKFPYGFLKLVRGCDLDAGGQWFIAVDFHDYRAALFDFDLTAHAYRRFEQAARLRLSEACKVASDVELGRCPDQGNVFLIVCAEDGPPDEQALLRFLIDYFGSGNVSSDLDLSFGETAVAWAKRKIPSLVYTLAS